MNLSIDTSTVRPRWLQVTIGMAVFIGIMLVMLAFYYGILPLIGIDVPDPRASIDMVSVLVIIIPPSVAYILVLGRMYKAQVQATLELMQIAAVKQFYINTAMAWSAFQGEVIDGMLKQRRVPGTLEKCLIRFSPFESKAVKYLLESCTLEPNEYLVVLIPDRNMIMTNRRLLTWDGKAYQEINFDNINSYQKYTGGGISALTLHFITKEGAPLEVKAQVAPSKELFDFAFAMRNWSETTV